LRQPADKPASQTRCGKVPTLLGVRGDATTEPPTSPTTPGQKGTAGLCAKHWASIQRIAWSLSECWFGACGPFALRKALGGDPKDRVVLSECWFWNRGPFAVSKAHAVSDRDRMVFVGVLVSGPRAVCFVQSTVHQSKGSHGLCRSVGFWTAGRLLCARHWVAIPRIAWSGRSVGLGTAGHCFVQSTGHQSKGSHGLCRSVGFGTAGHCPEQGPRCLRQRPYGLCRSVGFWTAGHLLCARPWESILRIAWSCRSVGLGPTGHVLCARPCAAIPRIAWSCRRC
ncbi:hypothetical protein FN846DRAFT_997180, partial [Sphaerosporella brunnea]